MPHLQCMRKRKKGSSGCWWTQNGWRNNEGLRVHYNWKTDQKREGIKQRWRWCFDQLSGLFWQVPQPPLYFLLLPSIPICQLVRKMWISTYWLQRSRVPRIHHRPQLASRGYSWSFPLFALQGSSHPNLARRKQLCRPNKSDGKPWFWDSGLTDNYESEKGADELVHPPSSSFQFVHTRYSLLQSLLQRFTSVL